MRRYHILKNKNVFVPGASGGIGEKIALEFAKHDCNLYLTGRNLKRLKRLKDRLSKDGIKTEFGIADLSNRNDINKVVEDVRRKLGDVDVLVNCAGIFISKSLAKSSIEDFEQCFNVNIRAPFMLSKAFFRRMVENGWGRIVNIGSSSAYHGSENTSIYCASKHAMLGLSRALQNELKKDNVRVFCISPGSAKTKMGKKVRNLNYETFMSPKEIAEYVSFVISFDTELVSEELRLFRM